jgi:hypothetical protein
MVPGMRTVEERFWAKLERAGDDECWMWKGAHTSEGYGLMYRQARPQQWYRSHRLAHELLVGPIPEGMHVLHRCDSPPCCNPAHLFLGTQADNNRDRARKGRSGGRKIRGAANGRAKLSPSDVAAIRRAYEQGATQVALAAGFGVSQPQISRIVRHKSYEE